ncbi:MAG TPA: PTS sugar transporter subunit IIA [Gammaproteobacteria bacterium]|nr:PTS sugar transporter subunit IIA [Gammaproteobacteria bacterium]
MNHLNELIVPARVLANAKADSRKRALEVLSELLSKDQPDLSQAEVMQGLVSRERLGSTAIGGGIAVPHGRAAGITQVIGALIRLNDPVNYGAEDGVPVDLMFAILVPLECTEAHAQFVSQVTLRLSDPDVCRHLREAKTSKALYACFADDEACARELRVGLHA